MKQLRKKTMGDYGVHIAEHALIDHKFMYMYTKVIPMQDILVNLAREGSHIEFAYSLLRSPKVDISLDRTITVEG